VAGRPRGPHRGPAGEDPAWSRCARSSSPSGGARRTCG
jgi:hypothetical protein